MALDPMRSACACDEVRELVAMRLRALREEASRLSHARQEGLQEVPVSGMMLRVRRSRIAL